MNEPVKLMLSITAAVAVVAGTLYGAVRLLEAESAATRAHAERTAKAAASSSTPSSTAAAAPRSEASVPRGRGEIYRCKQGETTVYSDTLCVGAASQVVDVRPTAGFQPPVPGPVASTADAGLQPPAPTAPGERDAGSLPKRASNKAACAAVRKAIEQVDAAARRGQSIVEQDRLRAQRKALVDQRGALDCHLVGE